jgi:hypothetical protein
MKVYAWMIFQTGVMARQKDLQNEQMHLLGTVDIVGFGVWEALSRARVIGVDYGRFLVL